MARLIPVLFALALSSLSLAQPSSNSPLAPPANGPRHADSTWVAIVDCTAHTEPGKTIEHAVVVFRDGRITDVLAGKDSRPAAAPAGAHIIEGKGLHLYPGFIDAYVEVDAPAPSGEPASLHWNRKVTPQRSALDGAGADEATASALRKLGFATACISPRGGVFRGTSAVVSLAKPADEQSAAKPPVYREKAYHAVAFEMGGGGYPSSEMGAIALIRQTFIDADWQQAARAAGQQIAPNCLDSLAPDGLKHASLTPWNLDSALGAPAMPMSLTAYSQLGGSLDPQLLAALPSPTTTPNYKWSFDKMPCIDESGWDLDKGIWIHAGDCEPGSQDTAQTNSSPRVDLGLLADFKPFTLFNADDELEVLRAAKVLKEFGRSGVILGCGEEYQRLDAIKATGLDFVLPLNFPQTPDVSTFAKAESTELKDLMAWEQAPTNPRRLAAAGVSFSLTTAKLRDRAEFSKNLKSALKHGLKEEQALAALTTTPAQLLGVQDQVGTIEPGKRANLILADGPIFGDKTKLRTLYIDGQPHELSPTPTDLEGRWDLAVAGEPKEDHYLTIDKDNGVTVHLKDKSSKATKSSVEQGKLSFSFEHEPLDGNAGVFLITAVIEKDASGKPIKLTGQGLKATGETFPWTGTRRPTTLAGSWPMKSETTSWEGGILVFDDKNELTLAAAPDLRPENVSFEDNMLSFKVGEDSVAAAVDFTATPPQIKGTINGSTPFLAKRAERTPRAKLSGSWTLPPGAPAGESLELVFDEAGRGVMVQGDKQARLEDVRVDQEKVTFSVDKKALGQEGTFKYDLKLSRPLMLAPTLSGTATDPDGAESKFAVQRRLGASPVGHWRIVQHDGKDIDPAAREGVTMDINTRGLTLTFTGDQTITIKSDDVHFAGNKATFTHSMEKLGGKGDSTDSVEAENNVGAQYLKGESTLADGSHHSYRAVRITDEPIKVAEGLTMTQDEAEKIKAIPEKLPVPFGPYGFTDQPKQQTIVFKNATIWTSAKDGILHDQQLMITGGKITGIGKGVDFASVDVGGQKPIVIDCTAKHITPGILDCHSHTGISRGVNEGGHAVTSECRIADVTDADDVNWYRQLAGGVTTVNSLHGSANAIGGQSQTNKLRWGCLNPDDMHFAGAKPGVKFALGENPRQVNFGGGGRRNNPDAPAQRYPASRMGVETLIRDRFTAAKEYDQKMGADTAELRGRLQKLEEQLAALNNMSPTREHRDIKQLTGQIASIKEQLAAKESSGVPLRRDLQLEALAEVLRGERLVHCHSYRQDEILMLCNVARDFNFKIGTFQHALEGYKIADYVLNSTVGGASGFADWWAYKVEVQDAIPQCFPIMHDVGVLVSFNSDSNELARRLNVDAAKAVKYGDLSPQEALKFVTINPARQLQVDKWVGSIEVGKDADLAIWSGDPLSAFSICDATYVDGRCLFSKEQDEANNKSITAERQRLIQKILSENRPKRDEGDNADGDQPRGPRGFGGGGGGGRRRGPRPPQE